VLAQGAVNYRRCFRALEDRYTRGLCWLVTDPTGRWHKAAGGKAGPSAIGGNVAAWERDAGGW